jgi:hypothetical protein
MAPEHLDHNGTTAKGDLRLPTAARQHALLLEYSTREYKLLLATPDYSRLISTTHDMPPVLTTTHDDPGRPRGPSGPPRARAAHTHSSVTRQKKQTILIRVFLNSSKDVSAQDLLCLALVVCFPELPGHALSATYLEYVAWGPVCSGEAADGPRVLAGRHKTSVVLALEQSVAGVSKDAVSGTKNH